MAGGFETQWFVENDPRAQAILRQHWPNAQIHGDITTVDFGNLPHVDILTGGFPCTDLSMAGKRVGITGSRSGLWREYARAIRNLRPQLALVENVTALRYPHRDKSTGIVEPAGIATVLGDLAEIGYDAEWHSLPASAVGAPHQRDRIFIMATPRANDAEKRGNFNMKDPRNGLPAAVRLWPTPCARDYRTGMPGRISKGHTLNLPEQLADETKTLAQLNPEWTEALMGYPKGWTDTNGQHHEERHNTSGNRRAPSKDSKDERKESEDSGTASSHK